jgi:hypothetical protein
VATVVRVLAPGPALATLALVLRARGRSVRHELALRWRSRYLGPERLLRVLGIVLVPRWRRS